MKLGIEDLFARLELELGSGHGAQTKIAVEVPARAIPSETWRRSLGSLGGEGFNVSRVVHGGAQE